LGQLDDQRSVIGGGYSNGCLEGGQGGGIRFGGTVVGLSAYDIIVEGCVFGSVGRVEHTFYAINEVTCGDLFAIAPGSLGVQLEGISHAIGRYSTVACGRDLLGDISLQAEVLVKSEKTFETP